MRTSLLLPMLLLVHGSATAQWTAIPTGTNDELEAVIILGDNDYLVAGEAGAAFRTTDGGSTWSPVIGLGNETIRDFIRLDAQTILGASDGYVLRSADNGDSWTLITVPIPDDVHAFARSGNVVIAVGRDGGIVRSEDLGVTWSAQASGTTERLFCAWAFDASNMIAAGRDGVGVRTTNGLTWGPIILPVGDDWDDIRFFPSAASVGLMAGEDGALLRSSDGGSTWALTSTGTTMGLTAIAITNAGDAIITGTTGTAIRSNDMGVSWSVMTSPVSASLNNVDAEGSTVVACGVDGTVLKLGGAVSIEDPMPASDLHLWPLPAQEVLNIQGDDLVGPVSVGIFGADGKAVAHYTLHGRERSMDISGLASGQYQMLVRDMHQRSLFGRFSVVR
ncbi:MAG: hypothetical protein R2811_07200 [Flavobacteriales bacterium]